MFVLDASVTASWFFPDEVDDYSERILELLRSSGASVPAIWTLEVANMFLMAERRRRLTEAQTSHLEEFLHNLPITVVDLGTDVGSILRLGRQHGLTAYDASYLDLATRNGWPLATRDTRLRNAADRAGVAEV